MDSAARHHAPVAAAAVPAGLRDRPRAVVTAYESGLVVPGRDRG